MGDFYDEFTDESVQKFFMEFPYLIYYKSGLAVIIR